MMLRFAMSMWVLDETGSATAFASILAISFVPMILGAPFGGVLADRMNRRTLMVILDAASAVTVALALVWFSAARFSIIAVGVMQVALSLLGIFETPTVESALPQMLRQYGDATMNTSAAIVSQVQQVSALIPSFLGGAVYSFFGIRPMMAVSVAAFAGAAAIECFIRLGMPERDEEMPTPLDDLKAALRFLTREKPNLLKMVLLASALNLVVLGYGAVGYAFVIRTQWGFDATVYGIADGLISVAALMGMFIVTMMAGRLKIGHMTKILTLLGLTVIPQGVACMLSGGNWTRLMALVAFACIGDVICSCANIIAVPAIQMRTPDAMLGKVMALLSALAMCMQPLGQMAYGWAFDHSPRPPQYFIASGAVLIAMALLSARCSRTRRLTTAGILFIDHNQSQRRPRFLQRKSGPYRLSVPLLEIGTERGELAAEIRVAAVNQRNALHIGRALCRQRGDQMAEAATQIRYINIAAGQRSRPENNR